MQINWMSNGKNGREIACVPNTQRKPESNRRSRTSENPKSKALNKQKGQKMIQTLLSFRRIDICLILMFAVFAAAIVLSMLILNSEKIATYVFRKLENLTQKIEAFNRRYSYHDEYDSEWMDYKRFKETEK